jgi:hypothetical protein
MHTKPANGTPNTSPAFPQLCIFVNNKLQSTPSSLHAILRNAINMKLDNVIYIIRFSTFKHYISYRFSTKILTNILYTRSNYIQGGTRTFCRKTFGRTDILPTVILPKGRFAERTVCRKDNLPRINNYVISSKCLGL